MNISQAAQQKTVFEAAQAYVLAGCSIVPVRGKQPTIGSWQVLQTKHISLEELYRWYKHNLLPGVAIITGQISNGLVIIDLDGKEAVSAFASTFPPYMNTFTVRSHNGLHLYYYSPDKINTTRVMNYQSIKEVGLRSDGAYTVAPPSLHPKGSHYKVSNPAQVMTTDLTQIQAWILDMIRAKNPPPPPRSAPAPSRTSSGRNPRYVKWVVNKELNRVRTATPGERNNALNLAAYCLGRLIANPNSGLVRSQIEQELEYAAADLARTDGTPSVLRTIKSGLDAGMKRTPLTIPEPKYGGNNRIS